MLSRVVLPAPFGPTTAVIDPAGNEMLQSRKAQKSP